MFKVPFSVHRSGFIPRWIVDTHTGSPLFSLCTLTEPHVELPGSSSFPVPLRSLEFLANLNYRYTLPI